MAGTIWIGINMVAERTSGGISGKGGKNVNPLYRPIKAVSDAVGRYMENAGEASRQIDLAEKYYGRKSPEFQKATNAYRGAVFQNRKPPKAK
jgi:hypothetical protein